MNNFQRNLIQHNKSAMDALKRAYEECPNSTAGSFIIIAFNALIQLENELEKGNGLYRGEQVCGDTYFQNNYRAAA